MAALQGLPSDRLRYPAEPMLATTLLIAAASAAILRPPFWVGLLLGQVAAALLVAWIARAPAPSSRLLRSLRGLAPIVLFAPLYHLTGRLNVGLPVWVLEGVPARFDAALFGGQPSLFLAERFPSLPFSEFVHAGYFGYLLLIPALPIVLAVQRRAGEVSQAVAVLSLCFFSCLFFYIWLPVTSPLYAYEPIGTPLAGGFFYRLTHRVASLGGVAGAAFPSSHAALSTLNLLLAFRRERRLFWITLVATIGLLVGTVYGRYHYFADTLAGVLLAGIVMALFGNRPPVAPDRLVTTGRPG